VIEILVSLFSYFSGNAACPVLIEGQIFKIYEPKTAQSYIQDYLSSSKKA